MQNKDYIEINATTSIETIQGLSAPTQAVLNNPTPEQVAAIPSSVIMIISVNTTIDAIQALSKTSKVVLSTDNQSNQAAAMPDGVHILIESFTPIAAIHALPIGATCALGKDTTKFQAAALPNDATVLIYRSTPIEAIAALRPSIKRLCLLLEVSAAQVKAIPPGVNNIAIMESTPISAIQALAEGVSVTLRTKTRADQAMAIPEHVKKIVIRGTPIETIRAISPNILISLGTYTTAEEIDAIPEVTQIEIDGETPMEVFDALKRKEQLKRIILGPAIRPEQIGAIPGGVTELMLHQTISKEAIANIPDTVKKFLVSEDFPIGILKYTIKMSRSRSASLRMAKDRFFPHEGNSKRLKTCGKKEQEAPDGLITLGTISK